VKFILWVVLLFFGACESCAVSAQDSPASKLDPLPKTLETHLALSAAPPYLRAQATVYILDPTKGYVLERQGTNGFTCYVQRTDYTREDYRNDLVVPECQDPEGSRTIAPVEFEIERLRIEGKLNPKQLKEEIEHKFETGVFHPPARPGIAYMLSPIARLYAGPGSQRTALMNMPHFMFFAPNIKAEDVGAAPPMGLYPYVIGSGPMKYIILNVGETEKAQIGRESADLLMEACRHRADLCFLVTTTQ